MKKLVALLLCVSLSSVLCACTDKAENVAPESTAEAEQQEATEETAETEETEETEEEAVDEVGNESDEMLLGDEGAGDYPSNFLEERCKKTSFESYDEIVSLLEPGEGYAYIDVMGCDEPLLVISNEFFNDGENGNNTLTACPYIRKTDGTCTAGSIFTTVSTSTPIAVSDEGLVYCATHDSMSKECLGSNGTPDASVMVMEYVYVEFDDAGEPSEYAGFVRAKNDLINDDIRDYEGDEAKEAFENAFADYEKCTKIDFTLVE